MEQQQEKREDQPTLRHQHEAATTDHRIDKARQQGSQRHGHEFKHSRSSGKRK